MEWLVLFAAIGLVVGAVVWLAGRALRRARADDGAAPDAGSGPRHVDVEALGTRDPDDTAP